MSSPPSDWCRSALEVSQGRCDMSMIEEAHLHERRQPFIFV